MGIIVINNLLEKYELDWIELGVLKNVVYMVVVVSIEEIFFIVFDLMKFDNLFDFFNLILNRVFEVVEFYVLGFVFLGLLLVLIDKYYDELEYYLKWIFGFEINVWFFLFVIFKFFNGVKGNVVLKLFNDIEVFEILFNIFVMYGDFGDLDYWLFLMWVIINVNYEKFIVN